MANDPKDNDPKGSPEDKLSEVLSARWDPGKLSSLMRGQESSSRAQKLDYGQRSRFEKRLGVDLGDVRIFTGDLAEEITKQHNAEALTIGNTGMIVMRESTQYRPGTAAYTSLLAHELTHVAQGRGEAVARKATSADLADHDASEAEAEAHEAAVMAEETTGTPASGQSHKKANESKAKKRQELVEKVLELFEEDLRMTHVRLGRVPSEV